MSQHEIEHTLAIPPRSKLELCITCFDAEQIYKVTWSSNGYEKKKYECVDEDNCLSIWARENSEPMNHRHSHLESWSDASDI